MELENLYNIYRANIGVNDVPLNENQTQIKVGDILVALYKNKEIRGEVSAVFENYYLLRGKNGSSIKVTMDDVTEHYPKNRLFENKSPMRKFSEPIEEQRPEQPLKKRGKMKILEDEEEQEMENSPDNQVDLSIENIQTIGKVVLYKGMKFSDIEKMFEKKLLSKEEYWYLLTEKPNEIHIIKNNEKAFQIQPFMNALVGHFLKSQNKLMNESYSQIKISGNNNFSVVTNIPQGVQKQLLNSIISLLSGIKK